MLVGIDFDNTIVSYDALFHSVAVDKSLVPPELTPTKLAVRDHLRRVGREDDWTELQGHVYGPGMRNAVPFPGVLDFFRWARDRNLDVAIVSHRTRHPFLGPQHDLHAAALAWVETFLVGPGLIAPGSMFLEPTKPQKLARIGTVACTHFIDDLPEILLADGFPTNTVPILFDPDTHHETPGGLLALSSWIDLRHHFEHLWAATH